MCAVSEAAMCDASQSTDPWDPAAAEFADGTGGSLDSVLSRLLMDNAAAAKAFNLEEEQVAEWRTGMRPVPKAVWEEAYKLLNGVVKMAQKVSEKLIASDPSKNATMRLTRYRDAAQYELTVQNLRGNKPIPFEAHTAAMLMIAQKLEAAGYDVEFVVQTDREVLAKISSGATTLH